MSFFTAPWSRVRYSVAVMASIGGELRRAWADLNEGLHALFSLSGPPRLVDALLREPVPRAPRPRPQPRPRHLRLVPDPDQNL